MKDDYIPKNESDRQADVDALNIVDTPNEKKYDRLTELATKIFKLPISTLTIIDDDREWFKACTGLDDKEGPRAISFCARCILQEGIMVINDTLEDELYKNNPYVTGEPHIRFYAGVPLKGPNGFHIGTFCIIDKKPRDLSEKEKQVLINLAYVAELEVNKVFLHDDSKRALEIKESYLAKLDEEGIESKETNKLIKELKEEVAKMA